MTSDERSGGGESVRIVLADDHVIVRQGLRLLLEREATFEVVAEASDAQSARRYLLGHRPDVLVLDLGLPGETGLEAIPGLRAQSPQTQIVILTAHDEPAAAREALRAGALGYVLKEAADSDLVEAVRRAAIGQTHVTPRLGARLATEPATRASDGLTERETAVLRLIALGHTNAEIAAQLYISVRTVEAHRAHLQEKLELRTRAELVTHALQTGLIGPDRGA
jgi:two-component system response regulator NreC